jgi:hypothetical protein
MGGLRTAVPDMLPTRRPIAMVCDTPFVVGGSGEPCDGESRSGCSGDSSDDRG